MQFIHLMTLLQVHRFVQIINCQLSLDSCPLWFNGTRLLHTSKRSSTVCFVWLVDWYVCKRLNTIFVILHLNVSRLSNCSSCYSHLFCTETWVNAIVGSFQVSYIVRKRPKYPIFSLILSFAHYVSCCLDTSELLTQGYGYFSVCSSGGNCFVDNTYVYKLHQ